MSLYLQHSITSDSYQAQSDDILNHFAGQWDEKKRKAARRAFSRRVTLWLTSACLGLFLFIMVMTLSLKRSAGNLGGTLRNTGPVAAGLAVRKSGTFYAHAGQTLRVQYNTQISIGDTRFVVMHQKFLPKTLDLRHVPSGAGIFDVYIPASGFYNLEIDDGATMSERANRNYAWDYNVSWELLD